MSLPGSHVLRKRSASWGGPPGPSWGYHWADLDILRSLNFQVFGDERTASFLRSADRRSGPGTEGLCRALSPLPRHPRAGCPGGLLPVLSRARRHEPIRSFWPYGTGGRRFRRAMRHRRARMGPQLLAQRAQAARIEAIPKN
ncbi:MAG: hypothetical protein FJ387_03180 [Verrucomicrobia bacterium]|nr:hypothetical protein [Verrucomicrobiota bacterium]